MATREYKVIDGNGKFVATYATESAAVDKANATGDGSVIHTPCGKSNYDCQCFALPKEHRRTPAAASYENARRAGRTRPGLIEILSDDDPRKLGYQFVENRRDRRARKIRGYRFSISRRIRNNVYA